MAEPLKKVFVSKAGDDPLVYVMSDETVDRVGDVIKADGWNLQNFVKNPVALFGHDHKFIVGHWTDVKIQGKQLIGRLNLLSKGISERLDEVIAAVEAGILRAVSVGFNIDPDEAERNKHGGYSFGAAELLECSLVSVPANPNALRKALDLNLSDEAKSLIFSEPTDPAALCSHAGSCADNLRDFDGAFCANTEIPSAPEQSAPKSKSAVVVRLGPAAPDRAPFVPRKIHPVRK
jgi:HK97 family phage prohead protease